MKFAFLAHPLSQESRSLLAVDNAGGLRREWGGDVFQFCRRLHANMAHRNEADTDEVVRVIDQYSGLMSGLGHQVDGRLYEIPMDAMQILNDPGRALEFMEEAVDQAAEWGAGIIGLGSMTGIVGGQGQHLADRGDVSITTGNSLTVFSAKQNLIRVCELIGIDLYDENVAIVGIPGSIGTALAKIVAPLCKSIVCVARRESRRAQQVADSVDGTLVTSIEDAAKSARIIISATSTGDCIDQKWLQPSSIVIDVAVPTDVKGSQCIREDILVLTGGMMMVPKTMSRDSMFIGFNHGMIPSCFGETMVLALEDRRECFSVGRNLCIDGILEIGSIAQQHQFDFTRLTSFGVPLSDKQITRFKKWHHKTSGSGAKCSTTRRKACEEPVSLNRNGRATNGNGRSLGSNGSATSPRSVYHRNGSHQNGNGKHSHPASKNGRTPQNDEHAKLASERHERYINPVLVALGKGSGFLKTFVRGEGNYLFDKDGNKYLDFVSGFGSLNLGHNHPAVTSAIQDAMQNQAPGFTQAAVNPHAASLAERLVASAPMSLEMVSFANSGAEAIEAAIKLVRGSSSRQDILYCYQSYHGKTLGALSVTGNDKFQRPFGPLISNTHAVDFGDVTQLADALCTRRYAAFFVEPIQCEGGMNIAADDYLGEVERLCKETGTLFVLDEIQTGLGRTGVMYAAETAGVSPDIMTLAKSLGGGLVPCGAMLCRSDLWMQAYGSIDRFLLHTSTFAGGSLACAAGLATLDVLENTDLLENCRNRSRQLEAGLRKLEKREVIQQVRGQGLLFGIEFTPTLDNIYRHFMAHDPTGLNQYLAPTALQAVKHMGPIYVMQTLLDEYGIYTQVARSKPSVLRVQPPLGISEQEIDEFLSAVEQSCDELSFINQTTDMMIAKSVMGNSDKRDSVHQ